MTDLIHRQLELPVPPAEVWLAVTDPQRLRAWLADDVEFELRPGGNASFVIGDRVLQGWVEEVRPPMGDSGVGRLAFWWAEGDEPASRVELTVTGLPHGTLLRVCESRPLDVVDLVGIPLGGQGGRGFGPALRAPAMVAA